MFLPSSLFIRVLDCRPICPFGITLQTATQQMSMEDPFSDKFELLGSQLTPLRSNPAGLSENLSSRTSEEPAGAVERLDFSCRRNQIGLVGTN